MLKILGTVKNEKISMEKVFMLNLISLVYSHPLFYNTYLPSVRGVLAFMV